MSAEDRREQILSAAVIEFAEGGLEGTSTDAIARRAGISQPYLFRLYTTKKALFVAAVERTFLRCVETFRSAADGLTGEAAKEAMGAAYMQLLSDRTFLQVQMQAYASCADPDVRAATRAGFNQLWDEAVVLTGLAEPSIHEFFAQGMLLNVAAAMGLDLDCPDDGLDLRLLGGEKATALAALLRGSADSTPAVVAGG
jgi:AcrR family transcriptional regulator